MKDLAVIDIGDHVQCDMCNTEYTKDSPECGGMLVGSYAYCPTCMDGMRKQLKRYAEEHLIGAHCPPGMTFHAWVMQLRGGDNTVRITSFDLDDL